MKSRVASSLQRKDGQHSIAGYMPLHSPLSGDEEEPTRLVLPQQDAELRRVVADHREVGKRREVGEETACKHEPDRQPHSLGTWRASRRTCGRGNTVLLALPQPDLVGDRDREQRVLRRRTQWTLGAATAERVSRSSAFADARGV